MRILGEKGLSGRLIVLMEVTQLVGLGLLIALPFVYRLMPQSLIDQYFLRGNFQLSLLFIEVSGVLFWLILNEARKILRTLSRGGPFLPQNVVSLKRISLLFLLLSALIFIKMVIDWSLLTVLLILFCIVAGLVCRVLAAAFDRAICIQTQEGHPPPPDPDAC